MGKPLDLTGQKFGKLTAIKRLDKKYVRSFYWLCLCDCGNYCEVPVPHLRSGNRTSCGCSQYDGLKIYNQIQSENNKISIGTRFGKLTVIEDLGIQSNGEGHNRRWYKCKCDCGNYKNLIGNALKTGNTLSCGECNFSSKGEYQIAQLLDEHNICYQHDVIFPQLYKETGRKLRFDFIIYDKDYDKPIRFIEFDGRQHITGPEASWTHGSSLEDIQTRDKIKNEFCFKHNYDLVRIPSHMLNHIKLEHILGNKFLITKEGGFCDE